MSDSDSIQRTTFIDTLLDELILLPPAVESLPPTRVPSPSFTLGSRPQHRFTLRSPFVSRYPITRSAKPERIEQVCQWLHDVGGAIVSPAEALAHIPVASAPMRIAPMFVDHWPELVELESADAIELQWLASASDSNQIDESTLAWPLEITSSAMLAKKMELVRQITDDQVPVGVAVPIGRVQRDIPFLIKIGVDFITLIMPRGLAITSPRHGQALAIMGARKCATEAHQPLKPILCNAAFRNGEDCAKLLGLGASGLLVDDWFDHAHPERKAAREVSNYHLLDELSRSIARSLDVPEANDSRSDQATQLKEELVAVLKRCGIQHMVHLHTALAAATQNAAVQTGLPLIGR